MKIIDVKKTLALALIMIILTVTVSAGELQDLAKKGDVKEMAAYLKKNPNQIDELDKNGETALIAAVKTGSLDMVKALLEKKADVNKPDTGGNAPLHWAAYTKQYDIALLLIKNKADLNKKTPGSFAPACFAVMQSDLKMLEILITNGADIHTTGFFNGTLLHFAASEGAEDIVKYLLDHGLDVHARSINKETPLEWAMYRGQYQVIDTLVDHGAKVKDVFDIWGNSVMTAALLTNSMVSVQNLLQRGADVNEKNADGRTALHTAVSPANERINLAMVKTLIDGGADVNAVMNDGVSVLMWAVKYADKDIVRLLLDKGAAVDPAGKEKTVHFSVLHNALFSGNDAKADMIVDVATQVNFTDASGKTPLMAAAEKGELNAVKKLINKKADIKAADAFYGMTVLHCAAIHGYEDIAVALLSAGADINALDRSQRSALDYAAQYGHKKLYDLLLKKGAKNDNKSVVAQNDLLTSELAQKQAVVWYLGNSGWAVKTQNNVLIFDYADYARSPIDASIANGHIVPEEIKDLTVTVFVSYLPPEHFDLQIYDWCKTVKKCTYVYGFNPNKITKYTGPEYIQMGLNKTKTVNGIEITTLLANVGGAGFLVTVDGITIYHPGDHAERTTDRSGPFSSEVDFIAKQKKHVDIAFLPVQGDYLGDPEIIKMGNYYTIEALSPSVVFPMHAGSMENICEKFSTEAAIKYPTVQFASAKNRGDHFHYADMKIQ